MNINKLKQKFKEEKKKEITIKDYMFTISVLNSLDMSKLFLKCQKEHKEIEIEIVLASVIGYKNIKVKDVLADHSDFTKEELEEEVKEFDVDVLAQFLGLKQDIMIDLYKDIAKNMADYTNKIAEQKKT
jgi:hypothetical protein